VILSLGFARHDLLVPPACSCALGVGRFSRGWFCVQRGTARFRALEREQKCKTEGDTSMTAWPPERDMVPADMGSIIRFLIEEKGRGSARPCANSPFLMGVLPLVVWKIRE
jgi:hypothetical protein